MSLESVEARLSLEQETRCQLLLRVNYRDYFYDGALSRVLLLGEVDEFVPVALGGQEVVIRRVEYSGDVVV